MPTAEITESKNVCPLDCPDTCSMRVTVRDGVAVELRGDPEHPFTRGFLCQKMARYLDRVYSPDRLLLPDEAGRAEGRGAVRADLAGTRRSTTIADRFAAIAGSADGPQAILPYSYYGTMGKLQSSSLDRRFFHRLGASLLDRTICASAGGARLRIHARPRPARRRPDGGAAVQVHRQLGLEHRQHEQPPLEPDDRGPQGRGDDRHHRPLPEPDRRPVRLAHPAPPRHRRRAGPGAHARDLARRAAGRRLPRPAARSAPSCSASACSRSIRPNASRRSPASTSRPSRRFAHRLAREQPSLIRLNYGLQRHHGGGMAVRTIACLPAIVGAWRHHGGGALLSTSGTYDFAMDRLTRPDLSPPGTRTDQHEPARRGPGRRAARPAGAGPVRLQLQPRRRRPRPAQGARRACARRPVHRRPRAVRDRHRRLRRHRPAGHDAARARRHPRLVRPSST